MEAARRILAKPATRKSPLGADLVRKLVLRLEQGSLAELQLASLIALGFFGFLRWDDLSNLTADNIQFEDSHMALFLEKRKNDQFREGSWVFISSSEVKPCPVEVVKKFLVQGCHAQGSKLFRRVQHTKNGWHLKKQGMSYSRANQLRRANQLLKAELKKEGLNVSRYSLHSLRAGGASAAAALGVPDRLFQRHGGWRSETAKNNYQEESLDSLLLVTKSIQDKKT
jgi:integrase